MAFGSQKVPALYPDCVVCMEHRQEQRERGLLQGRRCSIKQSVLDLQTHPPTWQSARWAWFWEGRLFYLLSSVSLRKSQKKSHKYWMRLGAARHGLWAKQCQHSIVLCWTSFFFFFQYEAVNAITLSTDLKQKSEIHFTTCSLTCSIHYHEFCRNLQVWLNSRGNTSVKSFPPIHCWR